MGTIKMNKTTMRTKKIGTFLILIIVLASYFYMQIRPAYCTTFLTEDFEDNQYTDTFPNGNPTQGAAITAIVDIGGDHGKVLQMNGSWNSYPWVATDQLSLGSINEVHFQCDYRITTAVGTGTFTMYSSLGMASDATSTPQAGFAENDTNLISNWETSCQNYSLLQAFVTSQWYQLDVYCDLDDDIAYFYIDGDLADSQAISYNWGTGNVDHGYLGNSFCGTFASGNYEKQFDNIVIDDEEHPSDASCPTSSSPELNVGFTINATGYTTPSTLNLSTADYNVVCTETTVTINASYRYTFNYWSVNGTTFYYSPSVTLSIGANTTLVIVYSGSWVPNPYVPTFAYDAINGTWFFRSDTHTIHEILAYRLDSVNTNTGIYDSRSIAGSCNISYGIRVWIIDIFGRNYELSGGTPEATVLRSSDGEGYQSAYFDCPAYTGLIDAVQVNVYQRFNEEPWSLRRYFITDEDLYIKLPASSWTIIYYTKRTTASTTAYFYHGSTSFNSKILFQYYRANPWDLALARLQAQNYLGFMHTPWTYYLGDIFWSLLLLFGIVTMYNRQGSLKPILSLLWLLGGVGSVISALIPALVLHIAWLMLAVAMGITLFKLIYT